MYQIQEYTYKKAKQLGVEVKPSKVKNKKIDVIKNGKRICSIGDIRYSDYPTYLRLGNISLANERRSLYHRRHNKDNVRGTCGWYSLNLLW